MRSPGTTGFTLLETAIAIVIAGTAVLALQATALVALTELRAVRARDAAVSLAERRAEMLSLLPCSAAAAGSDSADGAVVSWSAAPAPAGALARRVTIVAGFTSRGVAGEADLSAPARCP